MNYKITVGEYQKVHEITKSNLHNTDIESSMIAILTRLPHDQVEEMSLLEYASVKRKAEDILSVLGTDKRLKRIIKVRGNKYCVIINPNKLSAACYIKVADWMKEGADSVISNLHLFAACVLQPVKDYWLFKVKRKESFDERAEVLKDASFDDIHAICFYYRSLWNKSIELFKPVLETEISKHTAVNADQYADLAIETLKL